MGFIEYARLAADLWWPAWVGAGLFFSSVAAGCALARTEE